MTLSEFKYIFFFEWAHRVLGRGIGVAFGVPLAFFMYRGWVTKSLKTRLLALFGLGGLQGAIGWWMVKSGLKEDLDHPRVSAYRLVSIGIWKTRLLKRIPFRLATHLGSAFVIYLGILWTAMSLTVPKALPANSTHVAVPRSLKMGVHSLAGLTFLTAMSGAFVAGVKQKPFIVPHVIYRIRCRIIVSRNSLYGRRVGSS